MDELSTFKLTDVGTRYLHYVQLIDLFETGLGILKKLTYTSTLDIERAKELEIAIKLLKKQLDVMGDYDHLETMGIINTIPKNPKDIKD